MKKLLVLFSSIFLVFCLFACKSDNVTPISSEPTSTPIITVSATQLLPIDTAQNYVDYTLIASDVSTSDVIYHSDPIGKGDIISVKVSQYDEIKTQNDIRAEYDKEKSMRPTAETLSGIGDDAYIAFPSVHIYKNGYHITVTAGSGSDQTQHDLLTNLANVVTNNLNTYIQ